MSAGPVDLEIGSTLGNYRIVSLLGRGGMGVVYVGEHAILGRQAAIKVLLPEYSHNAELVDRFFKEARATAVLRHHAFVEVFDSGRLPGGSAYLVMEMLEGESLGAHLARRGRLPVVEAKAIARDIAEGVGYAHRHGIVHRDLKPDNVFLARGTDPDHPEVIAVKVLDFGIAKLSGAGDLSGSRTRTGAIIGTPLFMAPEQCRGAGRVVIDHRADIYALGCILHTMIAGQPPFPLEGFGEIIAAHLGELPPPLRALVPEVPPAVEALVLRLLAKRVEDRPASMDQLAQELSGAPREDDLATAPGTGGRARRGQTMRLEPTTPVPATRVMSAVAPRVRTPGTLTGAPGTRSELTPARGGRRWLVALVGAAAIAGGVGLFLLRSPPAGDGPPVADPQAIAPPAGVLAPAPGRAPIPEPDPPVPTARAPETAPPVEAAPPPVRTGAPEARPARQVTIKIDSTPPQAEVFNAQTGARLGETPVELAVPSSRKGVQYSIRKAGFRNKEIKLRQDQDAHLNVTLDRRALMPAAEPPAADDADDDRRKL